MLTDDVDALRSAAMVPPGRQNETLWWPMRGVALIELLARCGLRADEAVRAQIDWIDRRPTVPVLNMLGKGDKQRAVPMSHHVVEAVDAYLAQREQRLGRFGASTPLLVRVNGQPFLYGVLDRLVRGLAERAGVAFPKGAAQPAPPLRHDTGAVGRPPESVVAADGPRGPADIGDLHEGRLRSAHRGARQGRAPLRIHGQGPPRGVRIGDSPHSYWQLLPRRASSFARERSYAVCQSRWS